MHRGEKISPRPRVRSSFLRWALVSAAVLFAVFKVAEYVQREQVTKAWDQLSEGIGRDVSGNIQASFASYQSEVVRAVENVGSSTVLQDEMARGDGADRRAVFGVLIASTPPDLSIEIYSRQKELFAWEGSSGTSIDSAKLQNVPTSFVIDQPLYSYLVVVLPYSPLPSGRWYIVGKRLLDVNYPISNRFINKEAFSSTFTSRLISGVRFDFEHDTLVVPNAAERRVPLLGIDGGRLGDAIIPVPTFDGYLDEATQSWRKGGILSLVLVLILFSFGIVDFSAGRGGWVSILLQSIVIWGVRYSILWMEVPRSLVQTELFEPAIFASQFGFGIARSLGDLFLSSLALLLNAGIIISVRRRDSGSGILRGLNATGVRKGATLAGALIAVFLICLFLRALAATIHSAVFDSSILYNDPTFVFPSADLGIMLLSLGCISLAVMIVSLSLLESVKEAMSRAFTSLGDIGSISLLLGILASVSYAFGILQPNPLFTQTQRLIILFTMVILGLLHDRVSDRGQSSGGWVLNIAGAALLLIPFLDLKVHELDRSHVELLTDEIAQPTDHWQNVVMNGALDQLANGEAASILASHRNEDIEKLAFTQWAKSILSREGNNCSIRFLNESGVVVSEFVLGTTPHMNREQLFEIAPTKRYVDIEPPSSTGDIQWHRGYSPIYSDDGELRGGVWIELSSGRGTFLRGDAPELLKNYSKENFEEHFRKLEISEYDHDTLLASTNEAFARGRRLPRIIEKRRAAGWVEENISSRDYESYYFPYPQGEKQGSWLVISLEGLDFRWHLYSYLRYVLFFAVVGGILGLAAVGYSRVRGESRRLTFQAKLMIAFVIVSSLPILILAYYNREYAVEQADARITKKLKETTSLIAAQLERQERVSIPSELAKLSNGRCLAIADQLDADFNVYNGALLQATSRPEIFEAELLDRRLSATAVLAIMLGNANYISQNESIGNLPYVVGYRPLRAESGAIIGVLSMPTLFRQSEVDEDLTRRNVFLFGAYAIALVVTMLASTFFARQIASPIIRLRAMASRVAGGDYTTRIDSRRSDEIGELERTFDVMTANIKQSQEEKLKAQRELAWKEMAQQVAHEIKNPLTPMKLSVQHLQQAYRDGAGNFGDILKQVTRTVLEQIETLSRITSEFSQFARMPRRAITRCDVHLLLSDAMSLYRQHRDVRWKTQFFAGEVAVNADAEELRRAFINIFRNSLQAMEYRGSIEIETAVAGGDVVVSIVDSGPGISPELKDRLFTPNFSTKTDGMGLGLSIVRKTIEDAGGSIAIENMPGKGAAATIRLPLAKFSPGPQ